MEGRPGESLATIKLDVVREEVEKKIHRHQEVLSVQKNPIKKVRLLIIRNGLQTEKHQQKNEKKIKKKENQ